jgi:hypothetical protein
VATGSREENAMKQRGRALPRFRETRQCSSPPRRERIHPRVDTAKGRTNWRNLLTIVSGTGLGGTEVLGAAIAAGWAVAGLLDRGTAVEYAFMALFGALAIWALVGFVRSALKVEPITGR